MWKEGGVATVLTVVYMREVKTFPEFSCFCELSIQGKDKLEGTWDMTCANSRFIGLGYDDLLHFRIYNLLEGWFTDIPGRN